MDLKLQFLSKRILIYNINQVFSYPTSFRPGTLGKIDPRELHFPYKKIYFFCHRGEIEKIAHERDLHIFMCRVEPPGLCRKIFNMQSYLL